MISSLKILLIFSGIFLIFLGLFSSVSSASRKSWLARSRHCALEQVVRTQTKACKGSWWHDTDGGGMAGPESGSFQCAGEVHGYSAGKWSPTTKDKIVHCITQPRLRGLFCKR
eukprot:scaffold1254_cov251-Pinguiococcus_pyrenoidosus.AAC.17